MSLRAVPMQPNVYLSGSMDRRTLLTRTRVVVTLGRGPGFDVWCYIVQGFLCFPMHGSEAHWATTRNKHLLAEEKRQDSSVLMPKLGL